MILFMNKSDILKEKLQRSQPIPSHSHEQVQLMGGFLCSFRGLRLRSSMTSSSADEYDNSLTSVSSRSSMDSVVMTDPFSKSFSFYFPDYSGDPYDLEQVQEFLIQMFDSVRRLKQKRLFAHCTTAVDTENIKLVFNDVKSTILHRNISALMLQ